MAIIFIILQLNSLIAFSESFEHYYRDGVPRFKTLERTNHEVFLGDKVC
uniref:Uncharacterized protein n=1 Tax=Heterorhabditis bacteriophora TaxID=37862 RepID=A0A1I7WUR0_HETBA